MPVMVMSKSTWRLLDYCGGHVGDSQAMHGWSTVQSDKEADK